MGHKKVERISPLTLHMPCCGVDSHAHVDGEEFDEDREDVLALAKAAGVAAIGNVFLGPEEYARGKGYFAAHPEVFFLLGIHPCDGQRINEKSLAAMRAAFAADARLKAVGEIGLDFFWDDCPKELQYAALRAQLDMARDVDKPVVIHSRDAADETLMVLESAGFKDYPLLWHCFGGNADLLRRILGNGWHVSLPGPVTYKANADLRAAVPLIPADRLLLETDSPYLAAEPWRGKRNEPAFTVFTAACVAELRGMEKEALWQQAGDNARRFFGL